MALNENYPVSMIGALGTPLSDGEKLHHEGLELHLKEQWENGLRSTFVAGTMGFMPMLLDSTYRELVEQSQKICRDKIELLVGVSDTGTARVLERIEFTNRFELDGIVAMTPYFLPFSQEELIDFFTTLADCSTNPLFLYDIPGRTGVKLEMETVLRLAEHPNIRGGKFTCDVNWTRELFPKVDPDKFRVITVAPAEIEICMRQGMVQQLDGIFAMMPHWSGQMIEAVEAENWDEAKKIREKFGHLLDVIIPLDPFASYTVIAGDRGIPGRFAPLPFPQIDQDGIEKIRSDEIIMGA